MLDTISRGTRILAAVVRALSRSQSIPTAHSQPLRPAPGRVREPPSQEDPSRCPVPRPSRAECAGSPPWRSARSPPPAWPACSSSKKPRPPADDPNAKVTLTVGLFGTFGFKEAGLYDDYMKQHPNITIKEDDVEQSSDYWTRLKTRLASGSGLDDVQGVEIGFVSDVVQNHANQFVDFASLPEGNTLKSSFYDWKWQQASTSDGKTARAGHRRRSGGDLLPAGPAQGGRAALGRRPRWPASGRAGRTTSPSASSTRHRRPSRPAATSSTAPPRSSAPPSTRATRPTTTPAASRTSPTATA